MSNCHPLKVTTAESEVRMIQFMQAPNTGSPFSGVHLFYGE